MVLQNLQVYRRRPVTTALAKKFQFQYVYFYRVTKRYNITFKRSYHNHNPRILGIPFDPVIQIKLKSLIYHFRTMCNRWSGARVMLASKHRWSRSSWWLHIQRHNREWRRLHVGSSQWLHVWSRSNKWWLCGLCLCYYNRILWCSNRIHGYRVRRHLRIHTMNGDSIQNLLRLYRFANNQTDNKIPKITKITNITKKHPPAPQILGNTRDP